MSEEQKASMWRKWGSVVLGGMLVLLIGFEVGAEGVRSKLRETDTAVTDARVQMAEAAQTVAAAKTEMERFKAAYLVAVRQLEEMQKERDQARAMVRIAETSPGSCPFAPQRVTQ